MRRGEGSRGNKEGKEPGKEERHTEHTKQGERERHKDSQKKTDRTKRQRQGRGDKKEELRKSGDEIQFSNIGLQGLSRPAAFIEWFGIDG